MVRLLRLIPLNHANIMNELICYLLHTYRKETASEVHVNLFIKFDQTNILYNKNALKALNALFSQKTTTNKLRTVEIRFRYPVFAYVLQILTRP